MKAMLLAAGVGQRMLPLTLLLPKPMIPVLGRPLAFQHLRALAAAGVDEVVLNLHHLPAVIEAMLGDGTQYGLPRVRYTFEETLLGTAGGVRNARPWLEDDRPVIVTNSDSLADLDYAAVVRAHTASGCPATLVLVPERDGFSTVEIDGEGRILALAGAPRVDPRDVAARHVFAGVSIIEREVLERLPAQVPSCLVRDLYRQLAAERRLNAYVHGGFWWELGTPASYLDGSLRLLDLAPERLRSVCAEHDPVRRLDRAVAAVGPGAVVDEGTHLVGHVALGFASHVSQGCTVEDSVIMPEAWVGPGARLARSIVGPGAELPAGFEAELALVCSDPGVDRLPADTRRESGLLVRQFAGAIV